MSESKTTTNHQQIQSWIEERQGVPALVKGTESQGSAMLRVRFSDESSDDLKETDWETFFKIFDDNNLAFLYQEETQEGGKSRFFKFVER